MTADADFTILGAENAGFRLALTGPLTVGSVGAIDTRLRHVAEDAKGPGVIDLSAVSAIDTVGAWVVWRLARDTGAEIEGGSAQAMRLIHAVSASRGDARITPPYVSVFIRAPEAVGNVMTEIATGSLGVLGFLGDLIVVWLRAVRHPGRLRFTALCSQVEQMGVD